MHPSQANDTLTSLNKGTEVYGYRGEKRKRKKVHVRCEITINQKIETRCRQSEK